MPPMAYNGEVAGTVAAWGGYSNGYIPAESLCIASWTSTRKVRCDAAAALEEMNLAYRAYFGVNMTINSSYRTYAEQEALRLSSPGLAAPAGTSNHGWALAIDFGGGVGTFGSVQHNWLRENANRFGWFQPRWAQYDGSLPEAWHWEYAGAVASGRTDQSRALGVELLKLQPWDSPAQRTCLSDLWQLRSGWDYLATSSGSDRRGIPMASMVGLFGPYWVTTAVAAGYLRAPQAQIEWGLLDLSRQFGDACSGWAYWGPAVTATVTGPTTVPSGETSAISITYIKQREPVATATVTVEELHDGAWVDTAPVPITDGAATFTLEPGSTTTTYRLRNWDSSAVSEPFTIAVAEVTATVTGPTTVPSGGSTAVAITYTKDDLPVAAAAVTVQELRDGGWTDIGSAAVTAGAASYAVAPVVGTTYRVRNWDTSAVSEPFTVFVAEVKAAFTGSTTVMPGGTSTISVTYSKDGRPVAAATVTVQRLVWGEWTDADPVTITNGTGTHTLAPGLETTTYRIRNWNSSTISEPFTLTVIAPTFIDVGMDNPLRLSIEWLAIKGITTGYPDGTFRPAHAVNRDAMAAFLYRLAGRPAHTAPATSPFADLTPASPFYTEITWLAEQGITTGTRLPDGSAVFRPPEPVSREAMAAFLYRYAGQPAFEAPAESAFTDVRSDNRFAREIAWLADRGITTGTRLADGTVVFEPTVAVSRQAMAAFLHRYDTLPD